MHWWEILHKKRNFNLCVLVLLCDRKQHYLRNIDIFDIWSRGSDARWLIASLQAFETEMCLSSRSWLWLSQFDRSLGLSYQWHGDHTVRVCNECTIGWMYCILFNILQYCSFIHFTFVVGHFVLMPSMSDICTCESDVLMFVLFQHFIQNYFS